VIGEAIGNFRIVSRLGRGGMGEVYLAEQQSIGTRVAVKVLLAQISADAEHVQRFFNEARAVSRIQHAGIVKIFDVGFHASGHAYLVMEYLEGESLARRIQRSIRLSPAHIADLGRQIASVLDATHSAGITHRDLKPDNIFIVPDRELASRQRAKVLDFGIAKLTGTLAGNSPRTIGTMGTPAYMAPEQWGDASKVDWRADIYSLGCLVFEMACGRPPFVVTTLAEACGKHLTEIPVAASSLVPDLPPELDELIACMLEKRPDDRPQSMDVVVKRFEAIAAIVGPPPPMAIPAPNVHPDHPSSPSGRGDRAGGTGLGATVGTDYPVRDPGLAPTVGTDPPGPRATGPDPRMPERRLAPRRSKAPLALAALVLLGAGSVATAWFLRGRSAATPTPPIPAAVAEETNPFVCATPLALPTVDGAGEVPVKLRYDLRPSKEVEYTTRLHSTSALDDERGTVTGDLTLALTYRLTWWWALGDSFTGQLAIRKVGLDSEAKRQEPGKAAEYTTVRWRSEDPAAANELESLRSAVGQIISFQMTDRGQISNDNVVVLQEHLRKQNVPEILVELFSRDEIFRTLFIELPEHPIKVGDTWRGGELVRRLPSHGQIAAAYDYRVTAISGDRSQVVIETTPPLKLDLTGRIKVLSKQTAFQLWTMFDVSRGDLSSLHARACARMAIELDGKAVTGDAVLDTTASSRLVRSGTPTPAAIEPPSTRRPNAPRAHGAAAPRSPVEAPSVEPPSVAIPTPPPPPQTPSAPPQQPPPVHLPQKPDPGAVTRVLQTRVTQISHCGVHARDVRTVAVRVQINPDGSVASAAASSIATVKMCVEPLLTQLRFPPSLTGDVVTKNYALMPPPPRAGD